MKIVFAALKFDYGIAKRGESLEHRAFYPALMDNFETLVPFWLEDNGFPDDLIGLQERLLAFVEVENPDFVFFILMEYEIFPQTLLKLKDKWKIINWFCDDAWRFDSFTKFAAGNFTYCITVDKYSLFKYKAAGYNNVILSQWAAFDYVENANVSKAEYTFDVSFVGGKNPTREWIINCLRQNNIAVKCFGNGWEEGKISYERIKEIFLKSKINLNISNSVSNDIRFLKYLIGKLIISFLKIPLTRPRKSILNLKYYLSSLKSYFFGKKRVETIKARNFEIPGCGGFQLSQFALEIEDYYQIGTEIAIYSNIEDLVKQVTYYLGHTENREMIRENGHLRTREHTYSKRISEVLKSIN